MASLNCVVRPEEIEYFVQSLRKMSVQDVGTNVWIDGHEILLKLNQQAILEASQSGQEEIVKELLILHQKLPIMVHEAFCVLVWRTKVLPKLFELNEDPPATFLLYSVLVHEATAVSVLELALFHPNGCESLGETALDLIDYCVQGVTQLIGLVNIGHYREDTREAHENTAQELERQKRDIAYKIGMRCLTIISYLADKVDLLPLSAATRLVQIHDTPCLLSEILHCQPWMRHKRTIEKFVDERWTPVRGAAVLKVTKVEAQAWFCLRQLLFNTNIMRHYEINDFRQRELSKCQVLLNEHLLDQLPPLAELKHFLCTLSVTGKQTDPRNILLEELPQIRDSLIAEAKRAGFKKIAAEQADIFLRMSQPEMMTMATRLTEAYNTDLLASFEAKPSENLCGLCESEAIKKCSKCEAVFYCTRECQVKDWARHKVNCVALKSNA